LPYTTLFRSADRGHGLIPTHEGDRDLRLDRTRAGRCARLARDVALARGRSEHDEERTGTGGGGDCTRTGGLSPERAIGGVRRRDCDDAPAESVTMRGIDDRAGVDHLALRRGGLAR